LNKRNFTVDTASPRESHTPRIIFSISSGGYIGILENSELH